MREIKLACVGYLNAEPLVWPLEQKIIEHNLVITRATPSECMDMLLKHEVECALTPIAVLLDHPNLIPLPEIAIACRGQIASVLLFHNDPLSELSTIWLDPSSRTSNILMRILRSIISSTPCEFIIPDPSKEVGLPQISNLPPKIGRLVIGDNALLLGSQTSPTNFTDLGALWKELTNHPFTFARWIALSGDIAAELTGVLREARDWSVLHLHEMVDTLAERHGFESSLVDRYLRINVTYMFGPREEAGMHEFFRLARLLPER
jgi:chorismate dehydratase